MKFTLLQLTQSILSSLNSDEVNSIGDTTESLQVAECIRTSYLNMLGRYDLPEHNQIFQLTASTDSTKPVVMYRPDGINRIEWIKYYDSNPNDGGTQNTDQYGSYSHGVNTDIVVTVPWTATSTTTNTIQVGTQTFTINSSTLPIIVGQGVIVASGTNTMLGTVTSYIGTSLILNVTSVTGTGTYSSWTISEDNGLISPPGYTDVTLLELHKFIDMTNGFNTSESDVSTYSLTVINDATNEPNSFTFNYKTDRQPLYFTILSNYYILFDSYDNSQDNTLQASKSLAFGWVMPSFSMEDNFTPNLDEQQFPLLLNEAKSLAFLELKQTVHQKAEHEVMRQLSSLQKFKALANRPTPFEQLPSFGRRTGLGGYAIYRR